MPAKPVKATLTIIPGFDNKIVETTILEGAFCTCSMLYICTSEEIKFRFLDYTLLSRIP
jgi:hypothetical protein